MRMLKFILALGLAAPAYAGDRGVGNPEVGGNFFLSTNVGGTPTKQAILSNSGTLQVNSIQNLAGTGGPAASLPFVLTEPTDAAGVGVASNGLILVDDGANAFIKGYRFGGSGNAAWNIAGFKAGGTLTVPTAVVSGDSLAIYGGEGYDGSAFSNGQPGFRVVAEGTFGVGDHPAGLEFYTVPDNTTARVLAGAASNAGAWTFGFTGSSVIHAVNGNLTMTTANPRFVMQATTGSGNAQAVDFMNAAASGKFNFRAGNQVINSNRFEIVPSTAADGNTFSTAVFSVDNAGASATTSLTASGTGIAIVSSSNSGYFQATGRFGGTTNGAILVQNGSGANFGIAETASSAFTIGTYTTLPPSAGNPINPAIAFTNAGNVTLGPATGGAAHTLQSGGLTSLTIKSSGLGRLFFQDGATTRWQWESQTTGTLALFQGGSTNVMQVDNVGQWQMGGGAGTTDAITVNIGTNGGSGKTILKQSVTGSPGSILWNDVDDNEQWALEPVPNSGNGRFGIFKTAQGANMTPTIGTNSVWDVSAGGQMTAGVTGATTTTTHAINGRLKINSASRFSSGGIGAATSVMGTTGTNFVSPGNYDYDTGTDQTGGLVVIAWSVNGTRGVGIYTKVDNTLTLVLGSLGANLTVSGVSTSSGSGTGTQNAVRITTGAGNTGLSVGASVTFIGGI